MRQAQSWFRGDEFNRIKVISRPDDPAGTVYQRDRVGRQVPETGYVVAEIS